MIVYREISSLQNDLGISAKALYSVSHTIDKHYHKKNLRKENGEIRTLNVPSEELKLIQRRITDVLLSRMEVSSYATAYRYGYGPSSNAVPHIGHPVLLKLDIRHFFDSIIFSAVKKYAFPEDIFSEPVRILLSTLCTYREILPQGAPSSPAISNLILKEFDNTIGSWCSGRGITYTRYCDDMTFSGDFDTQPVICLVRRELLRYGFFLNDKKTKILHGGQRKTVTGYVINKKLNVSADYKRQIRQEMYYCMNYGIASHLGHIGTYITPARYVASLRGRVNFVLSANPRNAEFLKYKSWLTNEAARLSSGSEPYDKNKKADRLPLPDGIVHVPCFGDVDISKCPTELNLEGVDGQYTGKAELLRFVSNNFRTFEKSGKKFAVCCGENSLAAVILIVDGIFHEDSFESAKYLLSENGDFWHIISESDLGTDVRRGFPTFYRTLLKLFKDLKLLYTNIQADDDAPAAIVIPNYDKLVSGWLPRDRRKEILQRGIGLLAGEKNGMVLECLYGVELSDEDEQVLGRICNYKNGVFTLRCENGSLITKTLWDCEYLSARADWDSDFDSIFLYYIDFIQEIEEKIDYDLIGIGQDNSGLTMRNGGYKTLVFKMKN